MGKLATYYNYFYSTTSGAESRSFVVDLRFLQPILVSASQGSLRCRGVLVPACGARVPRAVAHSGGAVARIAILRALVAIVDAVLVALAPLLALPILAVLRIALWGGHRDALVRGEFNPRPRVRDVHVGAVPVAVVTTRAKL